MALRDRVLWFVSLQYVAGVWEFILCGQVRYVRGEARAGANHGSAEVELMLCIATKWNSVSVLWSHPPPSIV
jgi:hypothetical protein